VRRWLGNKEVEFVLGNGVIAVSPVGMSVVLRRGRTGASSGDNYKKKGAAIGLFSWLECLQRFTCGALCGSNGLELSAVRKKCDDSGFF